MSLIRLSKILLHGYNNFALRCRLLLRSPDIRRWGTDFDASSSSGIQSFLLCKHPIASAEPAKNWAFYSSSRMRLAYFQLLPSGSYYQNPVVLDRSPSRNHHYSQCFQACIYQSTGGVLDGTSLCSSCQSSFHLNKLLEIMRSKSVRERLSFETRLCLYCLFFAIDVDFARSVGRPRFV